MSNYILEVNNLYKKIGGNEVIKDISLELKPGEIVGIIGESESGKTTLIELILGLKKMTRGNVKINGYDIKKNFKKAMNFVGSVVESPEAYSNLSGYENLRLAGSMYDNIGSNRINEVIRICGLESRIHDKVSKYPLGLKQRLGLAIALLHSPNLLILDEPMKFLTPEGKENLRNLLLSFSIENNVSILLTSNDYDEVQDVCNRVYYLENGMIIGEKVLRNIGENIKENLIKNNGTKEYKDNYSDASSSNHIKYDENDKKIEKINKKELRRETKEAKKEAKGRKSEKNEYDNLYVDVRKNDKNSVTEKKDEIESSIPNLDEMNKSRLSEKNSGNNNEYTENARNENVNDIEDNNKSSKTPDAIYTLEVGSRVKAEKILEENNIELISSGKSSVKVRVNGISAFKMANLLEKNGVRVYEMKKENK